MVFAETRGVVNYPDGLNIRSGAGTENPIVGTLPYDGTVTIVGEVTASDGSKWYSITSLYGTGYVFAEYITVNQSSGSGSSTGTSYSPDTDFEAYLSAQGFPESYKPYLRSLHADYPNWRFIAMHTNLDWDEVIYRETHPVSVSLVPNSWSDAWKSVEPAAYNPETGEYIIFDSGGYVAANSYAVEYYMDPRNNMGSETIFQFLSNKFDSSTQTISGIEVIAEDSYLEWRDPGSGYNSFSELIYDVGEETGVNPMTIASMLIMEQGRSGSSDLISGTASGYEGYYNFFNIGAYYADGRSAVENGLIYAMNKGWDSQYKAILGGAEIYASNYVYNNKSTIYFQKYNVLNGMSRVGTGQYMTAIYAASSEGRIMASGYENLLHTGISFEIPVYENMPESACPLPTTIDVPTKPTPSENGGTSGGGESGSGTSGEETEKPEEKPVPKEPTLTSDSYTIGDYITGVPAELTCEAFLNNLSVSNGSVKIFDVDGNQIESLASYLVGTGFRITIYDSDGAAKMNRAVIIKGDNNGDGKVNSADALRTQRHSIGTLTLQGSQLAASDINGDGKYNSADAMLMQRYSIGTYDISW